MTGAEVFPPLFVMGRPKKNPSEPTEETEYIAFYCDTLGGVFVGDVCMYFVNGMLVTNDKDVIDALRNMAHLGVVERGAARLS